MNQMSISNMMKSIIPISRFNKGEAAKIFEEVESSGIKIVMKNSKPSCVLLSPLQYESIMEMLSDYLLIIEAKQRIEQNDDYGNISHEELLKQLGIEQADLDEIEVDVE